MQSAFCIASNTPGAGLQFVGFKYIRLIFVTFSYTISGILDFSVTTYPFPSSAVMFISSNVTGITFPTIFKTSLLFTIESAKSLFTFFIAAK